MQIPGTGLTDSVFGASNPNAPQDLDRDAFMQLLVTQLKNQDPLEPVQNEEFVAQLANFSSLEQLEELNGNILGMIALNQANAALAQVTSSSSLIGLEVRYADPETGQPTVGTVDSVVLQDGVAFLSIDGENVPLGNLTEVLGEGEPDADKDTSEGDGSSDDSTDA